MHQDLQLLLHRWKLVATFRRTRREHDELCKRDRQVAEMSLIGELKHTGQMGNVWRTARRLSGKALGPKRRRYDVPLREQPSKKHGRHFSHWMEQMVVAAPWRSTLRRDNMLITQYCPALHVPSLKLRRCLSEICNAFVNTYGDNSFAKQFHLGVSQQKCGESFCFHAGTYVLHVTVWGSNKTELPVAISTEGKRR